MVNLFDITRQAGNGTALDTLGRQFGLGGADVQRAVDALLPAFALAFQRSVANPSAFAELLNAIASGRYAVFFDGGPTAPAALPQSANGSSLVAQLFRSPAAADDIARQAAAVSGIGAKVLAEMMPTLAGILIGGMFRLATVEGMAQWLGQWSDALRVASQQLGGRPTAPPAHVMDPWTAWRDLAAAMAGSAHSRPPQPPGDPLAAWTRFVAEFWGSGPIEKQAPPPPSPTASPFDLLGGLFETGREVQAQQMAGFKNIMDRVWAQPPSR